MLKTFTYQFEDLSAINPINVQIKICADFFIFPKREHDALWTNQNPEGFVPQGFGFKCNRIANFIFPIR